MMPDCESCGGDNGVPIATPHGGVTCLCAACRGPRPAPLPTIPAPASPADELRELVNVMREMGVTRYERGDVRLELGASPRAESPPITDAQRRAMKREADAQHEALLFASSEGFPVEPDEEAST